jgi:hypothetical protein
MIVRFQVWRSAIAGDRLKVIFDLIKRWRDTGVGTVPTGSSHCFDNLLFCSPDVCDRSFAASVAEADQNKTRQREIPMHSGSPRSGT